MAFACNNETLGSLYSHALLNVTESFKSKNQLVNEQKFSTCQVSPEVIVLNFNQRSRGSILTGVTFCHWNILFSHCKASDAKIGIIANFV